jgi:putative redox protein
MDIDYDRLSKAVAATVHEIRDGSKDPVRRPRASISVVRDLQGEVTAGPFRFRTDAALDAGGFAQHPRPMDYLLGALASCQQMWCLRWAAQRGIRFSKLVIETGSVFDWRGEYLQEIDAGASELRVSYQVEGEGLTGETACEMADVVAKRCPVMATLRRAALVTEELRLAGLPVIVRQWKPGVDRAFIVPAGATP